jgi:small subunit ribosomal protein S1
MAYLIQGTEFNVNMPKQGEIRTGVIASIGSNQILVSIETKSEGLIAGYEFEQIPFEKRSTLVVGQEIPVFVINPEDSNGNVILSYTRAVEQMSWISVEKMVENDEVFNSEVSGYNKGGLIVPVHGLRGFVPASQISSLRRSLVVGDTPEQRWGKMIGEPISVRVIEVDRERRRLILSERTASTESRQSLKERVIEELQVGEVYNGRVTSLADFGAFVNINGADGLIHLSELSWERVQHPTEILEVGQEVKVKVISIDKEKKRIGLSLRALMEDPWRAKIEKFQVGQLIEGIITRLTKFGAFARLEGDIEGLIHISEISEQRIEHPREKLREGDVVTLRIIRIDPDQRRIGLSIRKVDSPAYADKDLKLLTHELNVMAAFETPTEELAITVAEKPSKKPVKRSAKKPPEKPSEKQAAQIEEQVEKPSEKPVEAPAEGSVELPPEELTENPEV